MKNAHIWMQLLGFEKNDGDRGVARFLSHVGFKPESICALFFHSDFVHLHRGMEKEYRLFDDNCSYYGVERGPERRRQEWTNYDVRTLSRELKARGIGLYAGIMGVYTNDRHHREWLSDHPELRAHRRDCIKSLVCLKRFKDGSYYEDFFIKKLIEVITDYDLAGVHLSDAFCPSARLYMSDYSRDMIEQFYNYSGINVAGDDVISRADWIWHNCRREWIGFYQWRWERFFKKVCDAVHAVGKEVWILGMYCTDPFETRYIYGFDTARVMKAGVDCITANILPTSVHFGASDGRPYFFHRMHMDIPFLRAQVGDVKKILSMIGVADASEGWNVIDKVPELVKRDIVTTLSYTKQDGTRATDGVFFCLGDGVSKQNWQRLSDYVDEGYAPLPKDRPAILWSDFAHEKMLDEYILTRRPSPHKQAYELFKAGVDFCGCVSADYDGMLFVPNYDMLSDDEKLALENKKFVATAPRGFEVRCDYQLKDVTLKLFTRGFVPEKKYTVTDDGIPSREHEPPRDIDPLVEELPFAKMSRDFILALADILKRHCP